MLDDHISSAQASGTSAAKGKQPDGASASPSQLAKDIKHLTIDSKEERGNTMDLKTPTQGSRSSNFKGSHSGRKNTPNQRYVSLRQYCSPDNVDRERVKKDLFKEDKSEIDKNGEEEIKKRMEEIPDKSLLRTGKVMY